MTYVITQACADSKDTACWDACPADAIHPGPGRPGFDRHAQLYIDPAECIDCGACEPACPVEAIFPEDEVPDEHAGAIAVNRDYFASPQAS
ncbi:ferredoxin family protein [Actinoplanes missouriensis]|uniref:4Fe-4S dicluster domain-containing protein n=1 Tax=Actinoplanes missouriensis TaxID=1866 RepID=UPI0033D315E8